MHWGAIEGSILKVIEGAARVAGIVLTGMMFLIIADVFMRYAFSKPINGVLEITEEVLMISVVFLTLASAPHIRVTFITERFRARTRGILRIVSLSPVLVFFVILDGRSFLNAVFSYSKRETSWGVIPFPLYPSRFLVFVGFTLLTLRLIIRFVHTVRGEED